MHRMQGWSDTPLTQKGINEAVEAGKTLRTSGLKFDKLYTSDSGRAVRTAQAIVESLQRPVRIQINQGLREQFFGSYEGVKIANVIKMVAKLTHCATIPEFIKKYGMGAFQNILSKQDPLHLAENDQQFWARYGKAVMSIIHHGSPDKPIVMIAHSRVITAIMAKFAPKLLSPIIPDNLSITKLEIPENQFKPKVAYYNRPLIKAK
ncbi:histidine phosphatase family protein [Acetilactobacillus jinshanensis]|uniref:phosphoglycerate mutase (2,3-diphosphoglycerate-dependent) n=2 Tax=Acetilactobacillus jinshanensis TaxID=1720083 RepID=A0A4P6ZME2_9LACO|nr:histidine phosphatase family protein [Acetilactobacillus jinshanensis]QBP18602.1 histidine phosphatase family protein [Acetilactobacillus jinshanensis]URL61478.1 histidine phosphatase family protein [uncultured bacterium]